MPQVTIELSKAVQGDAAAILMAINQALDTSGVFRLIDIKSRLYRPEFALVGDGQDNQAFVYVKVAIMAGRSDTVKAQLSQSLLNALKSLLDQDNPGLQYGVEVVELSAYYTKA